MYFEHVKGIIMFLVYILPENTLAGIHKNKIYLLIKFVCLSVSWVEVHTKQYLRFCIYALFVCLFVRLCLKIEAGDSGQGF